MFILEQLQVSRYSRPAGAGPTERNLCQQRKKIIETLAINTIYALTHGRGGRGGELGPSRRLPWRAWLPLEAMSCGSNFCGTTTRPIPPGPTARSLRAFQWPCVDARFTRCCIWPEVKDLDASKATDYGQLAVTLDNIKRFQQLDSRYAGVIQSIIGARAWK